MPRLIFADNFDRANNVNLGTHWTELVADVDIVSNAAETTVIASGFTLTHTTTVAHPALVDMAVSATCLNAAATAWGLYIRYIDSNNNYNVREMSTTVEVYKNVAGIETLLQSTANTPVNNDRMRGEVQGDRIRVYVNDVQIGTEVTDTAHTTAGHSAFLTFLLGTRIDDFQIWDFQVERRPKPILFLLGFAGGRARVRGHPPLLSRLARFVTVLVEAGTAFEVTVDDTVSLSDALALEFQKVFADSVSTSDALTLDFQKVIADTTAIADAVVLAVQLVVAESVAVADSAPTLQSGKEANVADTVSLSDALALQVTMTLAEAVAVADALSKSEEKLVGDALAIADAIAAGLAFEITISDTLGGGGGGGGGSQALIYLTESGRWAVRVAATGKVYMEL